MKNNESIATNFDFYFDILLADTETLKKAVYKIRYDVYCAELGWEENLPSGIEKDTYDEHSVHCLLKHRRSKNFAGCIRIVTASKTNKLPFEVNCKAAIDSNIIDPAKLDRDKIGEISRLAVPANYRKRKGDEIDSFSNDNAESQTYTYSEEERRHFPNIAVGLYLSSLANASLLRLDYIFVMMEPRLMRHLRRCGIIFEKAGNEIDYHGKRGLFYLRRENLTKHFSDEILELYQLIHDRIQQQM